MKKIIIIFLFLFINTYTAKAAEDAAAGFESNTNFKNKVTEFNKWLHDNGHHDYVTEEVSEVCKAEAKYSNLWYYNKCDQFQGKNNLKIKFYKDRWQVHPHAEPNRDTLIYYLWKTINHINGTVDDYWRFYKINPSKKPYKFKSKLKEDKFVKKELKRTAILSYLRFEDNKIVIDELSPKERLGEFIDNTTKFRSNSVGKSMIGYLAGHAICKGYIDSIDSKINDWPLIENTLYHDQKLIDLLNMNAGDHKYVTDVAFWDGTSNDDANLATYMRMIDGKKKSKSKYNYHGLLPNIIFNYIK